MRAVFVVVFLVAAGCSSTEPQNLGNPIDFEGAPDVYRSGHVLEGQRAPAYAASPLNSGTAALADVAGNVTLLTVWASWCSTCKGDEPTWQAWQQEYGARGFTVFAVSREISRTSADNYADDHDWAFPALWDPDVNDVFRMRDYQPNHVLIDRDGVVQSVYQGSLRARPGGAAGLAADIETLLAS